MRSAHAKHIKNTEALLSANNPENDNQAQFEMTVNDQDENVTDEQYQQAMKDIANDSPFAQHSSKNKTPIPVEVNEAAVTDETDVEVLPNAENVKYNVELMPGVVTVDEKQLNELMDQNITMKTEIGLLVGLFKNFEGLISGKANIMSLTIMLPKLIGNPEISAQIDAIQPIIEKYAKQS